MSQPPPAVEAEVPEGFIALLSQDHLVEFKSFLGDSVDAVGAVVKVEVDPTLEEVIAAQDWGSATNVKLVKGIPSSDSKALEVPRNTLKAPYCFHSTRRSPRGGKALPWVTKGHRSETWQPETQVDSVNFTMPNFAKWAPAKTSDH